MEPTGSGTLLTHGGGMIGYGAFMIAHAERGVAVSVVLSAPGERPYAELLAREAHAAVLEGAVPAEADAGVEILPGVADPLSAILPERPPLRPGTGELAALTGCFRSYTPWCPHFGVGVSAEGGAERLVLRAYSGVEAPTERHAARAARRAGRRRRSRVPRRRGSSPAERIAQPSAT